MKVKLFFPSKIKFKFEQYVSQHLRVMETRQKMKDRCPKLKGLCTELPYWGRT